MNTKIYPEDDKYTRAKRRKNKSKHDNDARRRDRLSPKVIKSKLKYKKYDMYDDEYDDDEEFDQLSEAEQSNIEYAKQVGLIV